MKFSFGTDECVFSQSVEAVDRDQAVAMARDELSLPPGSHFYLGEQTDIDASALVYADDIIDLMGVRIYDRVGEVSEDWPCPTKEQEQDLTDRLQAVIGKWLEETGNKPGFWAVDNVEQYEA